MGDQPEAAAAGAPRPRTALTEVRVDGDPYLVDGGLGAAEVAAALSGRDVLPVPAVWVGQQPGIYVFVGRGDQVRAALSRHLPSDELADLRVVAGVRRGRPYLAALTARRLVRLRRCDGLRSRDLPNLSLPLELDAPRPRPLEVVFALGWLGRGSPPDTWWRLFGDARGRPRLWIFDTGPTAGQLGECGRIGEEGYLRLPPAQFAHSTWPPFQGSMSAPVAWAFLLRQTLALVDGARLRDRVRAI